MPGLTVDTSPQSQSQSQLHSQESEETQTTISSSASPTHAPPYSPITPTLAAARLASAQNHAQQQQQQTYTHSQESQTVIPQPPPIPIKFEENPDALALKSAISILQMQARNATRDIQSLQRIKERAIGDPEGFREALGNGGLKTKGDDLFTGDGEDSDDEMEEAERDNLKRRRSLQNEQGKPNWEKLPAPQNVVRCPPINWNQYAVVGESLDKLHQDQVARPTEGMPQRLGPDGQFLFGGEVVRRQNDLGVAAPYLPGRDRIEKMGTRKGGKRS